MPGSGISEIAVNSALALIEAVAPKDEVEGALALQMACTHMAAMGVLARFDGGFASERRTMLFASAAAKLMRTYVSQVEALRQPIGIAFATLSQFDNLLGDRHGNRIAAVG